MAEGLTVPGRETNPSWNEKLLALKENDTPGHPGVPKSWEADGDEQEEGI